jgi:hypothetical protein
LGVEVVAVPDVGAPPVTPVDDIVLLGGDPDTIEAASLALADFGVLAIIDRSPMSRTVNTDIGRIHYNSWLYIGGTGPDIARAYTARPIESELKPQGRAWFIGAGGPMGRMHVQRAIQQANGPALIVCTESSQSRINELCTDFAAEAAARNIIFVCLNTKDTAAYEAGMAPFRTEGFDDIVVMAPIPSVIADAASYLAPGGLMNIFAGVNRGTMAALDLSSLYLHNKRFIGHSASTIEELRLMLRQAETGELTPNRSVAAIGSLSAARDGLQAVSDSTYPGKVVIFPHIKDMPLTALPDLKDALPSVYARLKNGREWTVEAETEFLRIMLED